MSVVIDHQVDESAHKDEYDGEFMDASVVDTSGDLQAAVDDCWFCSNCSITL